MAPTWRDGGLYYPRNDALADDDGNRTEVEPMTGNVLLGYARLNVPDGLLGPLQPAVGTGAHFTEPALTAVERDVEVSRPRSPTACCTPGCAACRAFRARGPSRSPGWQAGAAGRSRLTAR